MINKIEAKDKENFYKLGKFVNKKFDILFDFDILCNSLYDYIYGYYKDNELVGFIHITKLYENIDIVNLIVLEEYRRQGIGGYLVDYIINLFDDVKTIMLEVGENNINAINLYDKKGFIEISRRKNYYEKESAIIMKRDVN